MNELTGVPGGGMGEPDVETDLLLAPEPVADRLASWLGTVSAEAALAAQLPVALGDGEPGRIPE